MEDLGLDGPARLTVALQRCGITDALAAAADGAGLPLDQLPIVIVPELEGFETDSPAVTEPRLVEHLIDVLHGAGYRNVVVGATADTSSLWASNRDVFALADLLGYRFVTPAGLDYDIVDLSEDLAPAPFPPGSVLAGTQLARTWLQGVYRIVFAKNRTDEADGFSLGLRTAMRVLPQVDDQYHYSLAAPVGRVIAELLQATPVHLTLIDAVVSSHGSGGARAPKPLATDCVIASHDIWLADAIGATKMGLDPGTSRLFAHGPAVPTVPPDQVHGDLGSYPDFARPHPLVMRSSRARDAWATWARLVRPWLQVLDREAFPLSSPLDARINERLAPLFSDVDEDPAALGMLVVANQVLAGSAWGVDVYRTLFDKDAVRQPRVPLGFDHTAYSPAAYEAIVAELEGLQTLLSGASAQAPGLRWRRVAGATVFEYVRQVPIPFDEFVTRVDVAQVISLMNDYLGGVVVPLDHDDTGRVTRQAERNLYLPQPNYLVLWGGQPIDVGKVEVVRYGAEDHRLYWKTVVSENGSAVHDDGIAIFGRSPAGTDVTILGRQQFVLPPLLRDLPLELVPDLEQQLVTDAYRIFFDRTLANLEAVAEGRDVRIGRPWLPAGDPMAHEPLPGVALERMLEDALDWVGSLSDWLRTPTSRVDRPTPVGIDADGFSHFRAPPRGAPPPAATSPLADAAAEYWGGLVEAALRDLSRLPAVEST